MVKNKCVKFLKTRTGNIGINRMKLITLKVNMTNYEVRTRLWFVTSSIEQFFSVA